MTPGLKTSISDIKTKEHKGSEWLMTMKEYTSIRSWIHRNARPLDLARFSYHFENGSKENVMKALAFYQNEDGGFGHALEPDSWNEGSTPMTTNTAAEILLELGHRDRKHPMVVNMLRYLESGHGKKEDKWLFSIPENNLYPCAPWWHTDEEGTLTKFNPTASLLRFILDFGDYDSDLYMMALNHMEKMKIEFIESEGSSMHDLICLESIRAYLDEERLNQLEDEVIEKDPDQWMSYTCKPSAFIKDPKHPLMKTQKELMEVLLDTLEKTLHPEGYWEINWAWSDYEEAFHISRNWWRADLIIKNLLLLSSFGRLEKVPLGEEPF